MARTNRPTIVLSGTEREHLERVKNHPSSLQKHAWRADIILHIGSGHGLADTARVTGRSRECVARWWDRFLAERVDGLLYDATRRPGRPKTPEDSARGLVDLAISPPPPDASHWTLRTLADRTDGMSVSTVRNILREKGLRPHRVKMFKIPQGPEFRSRIYDIVGVCVNPPDHAVVMSVNERPRKRASGRTRKPLPMKEGQVATRGRDYRGDGTARLMAALDAATGKVVEQAVERRQSEELIAFLDSVAESVDPGVEIHVILDNPSSHRYAEIHEWLKERQDWTFHFTSASASWPDAVKVFFLKLVRQRFKNATFDSLDECVAAIEDFIGHGDETEARPFTWLRKPG